MHKQKQQEGYPEGLKLQAEEWGDVTVGPREPWEMVEQERTSCFASPGAAMELKSPSQLGLQE